MSLWLLRFFPQAESSTVHYIDVFSPPRDPGQNPGQRSDQKSVSRIKISGKNKLPQNDNYSSMCSRGFTFLIRSKGYAQIERVVAV